VQGTEKEKHWIIVYIRQGTHNTQKAMEDADKLDHLQWWDLAGDVKWYSSLEKSLVSYKLNMGTPEVAFVNIYLIFIFIQKPVHEGVIK
jgi:hypothetical protein